MSTRMHDADSDSDHFAKPVLRGHFHQAAFFIALGACSMLIVESVGIRSLIGTAVYSACLIALFGISALYHRPRWGPRHRVILRRLDHSAIFLLIAGTVTPIGLLGLSDASGGKLLTLTWSASLLGIFHALLQPLLGMKATKWLTTTLAIAIGWLAAPFVPEIGANLGWSSVLFLITGGILYTVGALIYAMRRPDPAPSFFGYHEIFHLLVIAAAVFHFVVIARLAT
jgi:hemolysin III